MNIKEFLKGYWKSCKSPITWVIWAVLFIAHYLTKHFSGEKGLDIFAIVLTVLVIGGVLFCIWAHFDIKKMDREIAKLKKGINAAEEAEEIIKSGDLSQMDRAIELTEQFAAVRNDINKPKKKFYFKNGALGVLTIQKKLVPNKESIRAGIIENFNRNNGTIE